MEILQRLITAVKSSIARGVIEAVIDSGDVQLCHISLLKGEYKEGVPRVQRFGFDSVPPSGAKSLVLFLGADRNRAVIVGENDPDNRIKDKPEGSSVMYDANGNFIFMKNDVLHINAVNALKIDAPDGVTVDTPNFQVTGQIKDLCNDGGATMSSMRSVFNIHTHLEHGQGVQSDPPQQKMEG